LSSSSGFWVVGEHNLDHAVVIIQIDNSDFIVAPSGNDHKVSVFVFNEGNITDGFFALDSAECNWDISSNSLEVKKRIQNMVLVENY
jgi:hypothetical protein